MLAVYFVIQKTSILVYYACVNVAQLHDRIGVAGLRKPNHVLANAQGTVGSMNLYWGEEESCKLI